MAGSLKWGSFGDVVFEYLTSPQYGSVQESKSAKTTEYNRIISRGADGALLGQKPAKEAAGLNLDTYSFTCKISTLLLKTLSLNVGENIALALGAGPFVGSALGEVSDDSRFYTNVESFIETLDTVLDTQDPLALMVGSVFKGMYTLDSKRTSPKHRPDGTLLHAVIQLNLSEFSQ